MLIDPGSLNPIEPLTPIERTTAMPYVSCPSCGYFQMTARTCCECHAVLVPDAVTPDLSTTTDVPTLMALLDYLESLPADV